MYNETPSNANFSLKLQFNGKFLIKLLHFCPFNFNEKIIRNSGSFQKYNDFVIKTLPFSNLMKLTIIKEKEETETHIMQQPPRRSK